MNVFKKFAAMTLASAVVLGTLAGCGSSGGDTAAPAGSGAAPAATGGATKDMAMFAASLANKIVSKDENGDLHISMNTEHMVNSIDKIHALYDKSCSAYPEDFSKYDSADFYNYGYNIFILETHFFLHLF